MNRNGTITMAMRELDRLKVIQAVVDGTLKPGRAAECLGLTDRQVRRLVNRVRAEGRPASCLDGAASLATIVCRQISPG